jgi:hypothetical protein
MMYFPFYVLLDSINLLTDNLFTNSHKEFCFNRSCYYSYANIIKINLKIILVLIFERICIKWCCFLLKDMIKCTNQFNCTQIWEKCYYKFTFFSKCKDIFVLYMFYLVIQIFKKFFLFFSAVEFISLTFIMLPNDYFNICRVHSPYLPPDIGTVYLLFQLFIILYLVFALSYIYYFLLTFLFIFFG